MSKASVKQSKAANLSSAKSAAAPVPAPKYEPKPEERAAVEAWFKRRDARPPAPRIKFEQKGGTSNIVLDHPEPKTAGILLMKAVGTYSGDFLYPLISQLTNVASKGSTANEEGVNFMLSVVKGMEPKDEIEAMLAAQMAAVHLATMTFARRLNHVDNLPQQDSAERAFNKLARTFTTQVEALKRYRTGGQQRVTVEHVHVHAGGQAVVGAVEVGGGVASENQRQPHAKAISYAPVAPLWSENPEREAVPLASDAERPMPHARRKVAGST